MKLKKATVSLEFKYQEFDTWITPSLSEIKDSEKFKVERTFISNLIKIIGPYVNYFSRLEDSTANNIAAAIINHTKSFEEKEMIRWFVSTASFLFLVTGKSDNNCKCQFPIFLKEVDKQSHFPSVVFKKGRPVTVAYKSIPRQIKSKQLAEILADFAHFPSIQLSLFVKYINFIIDQEDYKRSLWSIGNAFHRMMEIGLEDDFLLPLVVYQVRGSVSATGGHEPETFLRNIMVEWGLEAGIDFNINDHIVKSEIEEEGSVGKSKDKTRAYDCVIPCNAVGWKPKIFIQSQFYAGDSGSVSHKNVDQTRSSRTHIKKIVANPIFIEYLDGAGYYSSLNGDLKRLISMEDTADFFQIRTSPIKLRRILQDIGFLTPLELVHVWSLEENKYSNIIDHLLRDGYEQAEIDRVLRKSQNMGIVSLDSSSMSISVSSAFRENARRYFLLDSIVEYGDHLGGNTKITGSVLVPGFEGFYGVKLSEIALEIIPYSGLFKADWADSSIIFSDLQFLADKGRIIQC